MKTYAEKLRDPRWQKKRLEIMKRDEFSCNGCGDAESTLNVHHHYYEKGKMPWEYPDSAFSTLCENCHAWVESQKIKVLKYISHPVALETIVMLTEFDSIFDHGDFVTAIYPCSNYSERRIQSAKRVISLMNARIEEIESNK